MPLTTVPVTTPSRRYTISIGHGALDQLSSLLDAAGAPARRFVVSSPTVWRLHGARFAAACDATPIIVPDGETSKHLRTVSKVFDALVRAHAERASTVVTFGGGVIGDLAGFAAAAYLRGVSLVHVPTTLLAQVDSAIGGKVGVNHPLGKNLIGAFYQPHTVVVDPSVLSTLSRREFRAGLYEVVKYGMTSDADLFATTGTHRRAIVAQDPGALSTVIAASCRIKADVVSADEHESGLRRILNFGHTAGHALESVTRYRRFRHGEAVGYGMLVATDLAVARGTCPPSVHEALGTLLSKLGALPSVADIRVDDVVAAMQHDKKMVQGRLHFILPTAIGGYTIVNDVEPAEIRAALTRIGLAA